MNKQYRVSVVVPVYNEEDDLAACLDALAMQSVAPCEVLVVDNNSSDNTVAVALRYSFVTVLHEPKQGVVHARTTGFNAAKGDIIARIDGDTLVPEDWIANIQQIFQDTSVEAVSGVALYYNVALAPVFNAIDLFFRRRLAWQLRDRVYLYGANMAMRSSAWQRVRAHLCSRGGMHEDYDIALHLQEIGGKVTFDERLRAKVSSRRIDVGYLSFLRYVWIAPNTYAQHNVRSRWHMYWVVLLCAVCYLPARILHRGYSPETDSFSFAKVFEPSRLTVRVDPTANVAD